MRPHGADSLTVAVRGVRRPPGKIARPRGPAAVSEGRPPREPPPGLPAPPPAAAPTAPRTCGSREPSDAALLGELAAGGAAAGAAFTTLADRHAAAVYRVARRLLNDPADAEDVRQQAFLALLDAPEKAAGVTNARAWLCRCAAKNRLRAASRRRSRHAARAAVPPAPPDPAAAAEASEAAARLRAALDRLTPDQRAVLALRFDGGLTVAEAAAALDIPVGTAKDRGRVAVKRLRALWPNRGPRDDRRPAPRRLAG